jgi:hypothetical protein
MHMIPALAYVAAAIWLAQVALCAHLIRTRPAPNLPPVEPVEAPPALERVGVGLAEISALDSYYATDLRRLRRRILGLDVTDGTARRCSRCGLEIEHGC